MGHSTSIGFLMQYKTYINASLFAQRWFSRYNIVLIINHFSGCRVEW